MKIVGELYKIQSARGLEKIGIEDIAELKAGLIISKIEIVGKDRQGVILSFKDTNHVHKCNRSDVFAIADEYKLSDTDQFVGKKVYFANVNDFVRISFAKPKK
jgi:hypothetical protein